VRRYVHPDTGELVKGSSVLLRTTMRTHDDERHRRACYDAMRGIGEFVAEKFVDIVKGRNRMAKMLGYVDFYDYKVRLYRLRSISLSPACLESHGPCGLFSIGDRFEQPTASSISSSSSASPQTHRCTTPSGTLLISVNTDRNGRPRAGG
jgi:hypothetical protein